MAHARRHDENGATPVAPAAADRCRDTCAKIISTYEGNQESSEMNLSHRQSRLAFVGNALVSSRHRDAGQRRLAASRRR